MHVQLSQSPIRISDGGGEGLGRLSSYTLHVWKEAGV